MARLELRKVRQVSQLELADKPITIGRSSDNDLVLSDTHVSRHHCIIELVDGTPQVRDLNSHGGTFVNGQRVTQASLHHRDRVAIGPFDLLFKNAQQHISSNGDMPVALVSSDDTGHGEPTELEQQLRERQSQLDRREHDLAQREAELDQPETLDHDAIRSQLQQLQQQLDAERTEHAAHTERIATLLEQLEASNAHVAQLSAKLEELSATALTSQQRIDELEAQRRRESTQAAETLATAHCEVQTLRAHEATLQEQVDALQSARQSAIERAEQTTVALNALRGQVRGLDEAARKVTAIQNRLSEIESVFVEIDEQLENASEVDDDQLEAAAMQRQQISAELETLNQLRDAAVIQLSQSAQALRSAADRQTMQITVVRNFNRPTSASANRSARRWWQFGRKT